MFSHIFVGVKDFKRAFAFYDAITKELGLALRFSNPENGWAGWQMAGGGRPLFVIGLPFDGNPHAAGNGQMVAFLANTREMVRRVHKTALANGASCDGPPGLRTHYHPDYYGAYFRDTEGNKVCIACHTAEPEPATFVASDSGAATQASRQRSMHIARLVPSHAVEYRTLMLEAYERHPDAFTSSVAERAALPPSWWETRLKDDANAAELVLGGFLDGQLAGVAGLSFESREKARHKANLFGMYIAPAYRKHGLGRLLVEAALAQARANPAIRLVQLTVTQGNHAAQTLYERHGFVPFGVEPLAVAVGGQFASKVHMWCELVRDRT